MNVEESLSAVRDLERNGQLLAAYDAARDALKEFPNHLGLMHRAVLLLARTGAIEHAYDFFRKYNLNNRREEEIAALGARLLKDRASVATGAKRQKQILEAAKAYESVYHASGGYYPAINAATLYLLGGRTKLAHKLAHEVLALCDGQGTSENAYYLAATEAEAALIARDDHRAHVALQRASSLHTGDWAAVSSTRRQLRQICNHYDISIEILSELQPPSVIHYCGHMISPPNIPGVFPTSAENDVARQIADYLSERRVGFGYGSLACGGDILVAEALIRHGAELHVVLPFDTEEFRQLSVARGGPTWAERFDTCMSKATSITYATRDSYLDDDGLLVYTGQLGMGLALLHARYLDSDISQLAIWDEKPARGQAGTAIDVAFWRTLGYSTKIINSQPSRLTNKKKSVKKRCRQRHVSGGRRMRALLFGDFMGFSRLREAQAKLFLETVLKRIAAVLSRYEDFVLYRNTWGDGLFLVLRDASSAVTCAMDIQTCLADIDLVALGLPENLSLRIGGHYGPVFEGIDPLTKRLTFFGSHVTHAARIEPVTPPGLVYVTEPFAAVLALDKDLKYRCEYVGKLRAAKDYGELRMYSVTKQKSHQRKLKKRGTSVARKRV